MKGKVIIATTLFLGLSALYFFCPRKVSFELAIEMTRSNDDFDNSQFMSYHYVRSADELVYLWVDFYGYLSARQKDKKGYDSLFVSTFAKSLDFEKYDYLLAFRRQFKALHHSPYLTKTEDLLYHDKRIPLIPTWDSEITDQIYIYRIKKNRRFRAPGP